MAERILVTGAGGFIGHHLVKYLKSRGYWVRGVDVKYPEYETSSADECDICDLRRRDHCLVSTKGIDQVYNLAADMGGIGYITAYLADIARNNILINTHMLEENRLAQKHHLPFLTVSEDLPYLSQVYLQVDFSTSQFISTS